MTISEYLKIDSRNPALKKNNSEKTELSLEEVEQLGQIKTEAKRLYKRKDFVAALARFEDATRIVPGDLEFMYYQALCLFQLHQWEKAEELFKHIIELDELMLLPDVRKMLSLTLLKRNNFAAAEEVLNQAVRDHRNDTQLLNMLGYCLERQNKLIDAERILNKLIEKDPENSNGCNSLAYVYCRLERNFSEAIELVKKALVKEPKNPSYLDTLGMLYSKKGNIPAARKTLKKALEFSPGHSEIMNHLTQI